MLLFCQATSLDLRWVNSADTRTFIYFKNKICRKGASVVSNCSCRPYIQLIYSLFNLHSWWCVKDENIQLVLKLSEVALSISLTSGRSTSSSLSPHHGRDVADSLDRSRQQESCCLQTLQLGRYWDIGYGGLFICSVGPFSILTINLVCEYQ